MTPEEERAAEAERLRKKLEREGKVKSHKPKHEKRDEGSGRPGKRRK